MTARRARADAATVDQRVDTIATLILQGKTTSKIRRNPAIRKWKLADRTIDEYIAKARQEIRARGEFDKVDEFAKAIARLEQLYGMAVEDRNVSAARAVVNDLCRLVGIEGPIHVKVEGNVTVTTFAEVARLALEKRAADAPPEETPDA